MLVVNTSLTFPEQFIDIYKMSTPISRISSCYQESEMDART